MKTMGPICLQFEGIVWWKKITRLFSWIGKQKRVQVTPSVCGFHPCFFCMAFLVGFQGLWRYAAECRATVFWPLVRCKPQWSQLFVVFVRKVCRLDTSETKRKKKVPRGMQYFQLVPCYELIITLNSQIFLRFRHLLPTPPPSCRRRFSRPFDGSEFHADAGTPRFRFCSWKDTGDR